MGKWDDEQEKIFTDYGAGRAGQNIPTIGGQRGYQEWQKAQPSYSYDWSSPTPGPTPSYSSYGSSSGAELSPAGKLVLIFCILAAVIGIATQNLFVGLIGAGAIMGGIYLIARALAAFFETRVGIAIATGMRWFFGVSLGAGLCGVIFFVFGLTNLDLVLVHITHLTPYGIGVLVAGACIIAMPILSVALPRPTSELAREILWKLRIATVVVMLGIGVAILLQINS